jgi:hypothetical protein
MPSEPLHERTCRVPSDQGHLQEHDPTLKRYLRNPQNGIDAHLCERCRSIDFAAILSVLPQVPWFRELFHFGSYVSDFKEVFCEDCALCGLITHSFAGREAIPTHGTSGGKVSLTVYGECRFRVADSSRSYFESPELVFLPTSDLQKDVNTGPFSPLLSSVSYQLLLYQINSCIERCSQTHETATKLPMKVIDCKTLRIVPPVAGVKYVALSYVWGPNAPEAETNGKDELTNLPRTIADAVTVTLNLGQQFLWVDRYCINQHDHVVKQREISNMGDIYAGAWVTIVSLASHINAGLPGVSVLPKKMNRTTVRTSQGCLYVLDPINQFRQNMITKTPWAHRGWTFQEAILSPRLLIFTVEQAVLLCESAITQEWQYWYKAHEHGKLMSGSRSLARGKSTILFGYPEIDEIRPMRALSQYCKRDLSFETDSLSAIHGFMCAHDLMSYWGVFAGPDRRLLAKGQHCAGDCFITSLLWYHKTLQNRHQVALMPSWSWASQRYGADFDIVKELLTVQLRPNNPDEMKARADVFIPWGANAELTTVESLVQDLHHRGPLPHESRVLGIKSRITIFAQSPNDEDGKLLLFMAPSPLRELGKPHTLAFHLDRPTMIREHEPIKGNPSRRFR